VFLAVCLTGALVVGGTGVLLVLGLDRGSTLPRPVVLAIEIAPAIGFVVGTWWVSRRLDAGRHAS
jgi:hypothetical protein